MTIVDAAPLVAFLNRGLRAKGKTVDERCLDDLRRRFDQSVRIGTGDGCWEWTKYRVSGYGSISVRDTQFAAHRLAFIGAFGRIPGRLFVLHRCDNSACVRPDHLFAGTQRDNVKDMWGKGRGIKPPIRRGINHPKVSVDDVRVREAVAMRAQGCPQREVARRFGVSQSTVWRWTHGITRSQ